MTGYRLNKRKMFSYSILWTAQIFVLFLLQLGWSKLSEAPVVQPFQFPGQVEIGKVASATCTVVSGAPPFIFKWYKNGNIIQDENVHTQRKLSNLVIDPVEKTSGGNYTCIVSNVDGKGSFSSVLNVRAPPTWVKEPEDIETVEGQKASSDCVAVGSPSPSIKWRKIGSLFQGNDMHNFVESNSNGTLKFYPVYKSDEGIYLCTADNGAGPLLEKTITVKVYGSNT